MAPKIEVPFYSYDQLRKSAEAFLQKFSPGTVLPVPIEEIAEQGMSLDIIPIPELLRTYQVDGFISSDLASITVDQFIMENRLNRYRFTIAHELAHKYLHGEIYRRHKFVTIDDWEKFQQEIDEKDYEWLEWQAYSFAGLALVPSGPLKVFLDEAKQKAELIGLEPDSDIALRYATRSLSATFQVSESVIDKRIQKDGLWKAR